jgi:hypothetical protein
LIYNFLSTPEHFHSECLIYNFCTGRKTIYDNTP